MRKKVDSRIRTLIENGVKQNHRSFFVMIGDKGRDQIVNLHYILSKATVKARPTVLWCYKKELGFSTHKQKRNRILKKKMKKNKEGENEEDPFDLFLNSTNIRYCYYKDTHKVLGNTFGMLVLQDFEALTPNLLARTIETVEGGGIVVLLLKTMTSLRKLYAISMDVHSRYRTKSKDIVVPRFNERFTLSLISCKSCLVIDDELNVLPLSSHARNLVPITIEAGKLLSKNQIELKELKESLVDHQPMGGICALTKTLDQAKAVLTFMEAISEKTLRTTVTLTASRGRGKSAALGLAVSAAVGLGYSNIFVTSPSPENLRTFFEFVFKGFDSMGYKEHSDYELIESTSPELNHAIVRVNIFHSHRQTIQYVLPQDFEKLGQAELVVIDEAAAIPLPYVKKLLGPYLIFMASTINGYEGTGRSLSLKLIQQLREQSKSNPSNTTSSTTGRILRELALEEPIRYSECDQVEKWLNDLLCLDCTAIKRIHSGCPHPSQCELYYVNKDTLFSYHTASEEFLHRMMSLYVSSHYKNTPNDLMMISDAPAHHLFTLLGPITDNELPEILCVIQIAFEGEISKGIILDSLSKGERASGDLIPWTVSQQFQDSDFGSLSGARIVRIATHPDFQRMGYGKRALEQLAAYFEGKITNLDDLKDDDRFKIDENSNNEEENEDNEDVLVPRTNLPPLLQKLSERKPEALHYLGTSFGITHQLFCFWKKSKYFPVYIRQTANETTAEHSCIMLHALHVQDVLPDWLEKFSSDFHKRFLNLLSYNLSNFTSTLALEIESSCFKPKEKALLSKSELDFFFSQYDQKRLLSYANNLVDYHLVMDLLPCIGQLYFSNKFDFALSPVHAAVILGLSLQRKSIDDLMVRHSLS